MSRKMMWAVLVIGVALTAAPFAMGLPSKADGGQKMIDAFDPIMEQDNVDTTAEYYYDVFVPLGEVVPAMSQENVDKFNAYLDGFEGMGTDAQNLGPALAAALGMSEEQVQAFFGSQFPSMAQMLQGLPQMQTDFSGLLALMDANVGIFERVPAGLEHYKPLVDTMQAERENYDKVAALPDFRLFTWFFVVPGVLLVAVALLGLFAGRPDDDAVAQHKPAERSPGELVGAGSGR
jgi:hypothetical protein